MTTFPAYAGRFELFPGEAYAARHLAALFSSLQRLDFTLRVDDPGVNQGQMASDFDSALKRAMQGHGAQACDLGLPPGVPQELDFAFRYADRTVAVEIEKANREKILRDILKCHMYLSAGADFAIIGLPKNYAHTHGTWNLFEFGIARYQECLKYGFGAPDKFDRILLLGFEQCCAETGVPFSKQWRSEIRRRAGAPRS